MLHDVLPLRLCFLFSRIQVASVHGTAMGDGEAVQVLPARELWLQECKYLMVELAMIYNV